jgi:putative transposase
MARQPRFVLPGQPQHVIQRGNNRDVIFVAEEDYQFFLEKLALACQRFGCQVHAYVLMTNHVHLLMTPDAEKSIGQVMQSVGWYRRTGTLWEGRYKATLIDAEDYLLNCYRYIELNPVRAGMVNHPGAYPWSSYRCTALGKENCLVTPHALYGQLGLNEAECQQCYRGLFAQPLDEQVVERIREATNKTWLLGKIRSMGSDSIDHQRT